ncbi:hypothetical protein JCM11641_002010 [Rhodosporidiobolus odoratus]
MTPEEVKALQKKAEQLEKQNAELQKGGNVEMTNEQFERMMAGREKESSSKSAKPIKYSEAAEGEDAVASGLPTVVNFEGDTPVASDILRCLKADLYPPLAVYDNECLHHASSTFRSFLPTTFTGHKAKDKAKEAFIPYNKLSFLLPQNRFLPATLKLARALCAFALDVMARADKDGAWPVYLAYALERLNGWMAVMEDGGNAGQFGFAEWDEATFTGACATFGVSASGDMRFKSERSGKAVSVWGAAVKIALESTSGANAKVDKIVEQQQSIASRTIRGAQPSGTVPSNLYYKPAFVEMEGASYVGAAVSGGNAAKPSGGAGRGGFGGGRGGFGGGYGGGFGGGGFGQVNSQAGAAPSGSGLGGNRFTPYGGGKTEGGSAAAGGGAPTGPTSFPCANCGQRGHFYTVCRIVNTKIRREGSNFLVPTDKVVDGKTWFCRNHVHGLCNNPNCRFQHGIAERFESFLYEYPELASIERFQKIPGIIRFGSTLGIKPFPPNSKSFLPENKIQDSSLYHFVDEHVEKMKKSGKMWGGFKVADVEKVVGPIQPFPISLADKAPLPDQPVRKRIVENMSFLYAPLEDGTNSLNAQLDSDDFPATWTTFRDTERWMRQ